MKSLALRLYVAVQALRDESGQDLIEYALVVSLIAFAAIAGMNSLASGINTAFSNVAGKLATAT